MTYDEHQRERMHVWLCIRSYGGISPADDADQALAEFDKRFPAPRVSQAYDEAFNDGWREAQRAAKAPAAVEPVPDQSAMGRAVAGTILAQEAELASLRTKARLWDAVASGKVRLTNLPEGTWHTSSGTRTGVTRIGYGKTADEAVQAAIDAGALK